MWTRAIKSDPIRYKLMCLSLLVGGCSSIPDDLGRSDIDKLASEKGLRIEANSNSANLSNLTINDAVQFGIANNPQIQGLVHELGYSAADVYDAGRIRNPVLSASMLESSESGGVDMLTIGVAASIGDVLTLSSRSEGAQVEFDATKHRIASELIDFGAQVESAYYDYIASQKIKTLRQQSLEAATLSLTLLERFYLAGNLAPKEIAIERSKASQHQLNTLHAEAETFEARVRLASLLGLSVGASWEVDDALPLPSSDDLGISDLLSLANERLDFTAAKTRANDLARQLKVLNWSRFTEDLSIGLERERESNGDVSRGPTLEWELPLFNRKRSDLLRVETQLLIEREAIKTLANSIEADVRLAHAKMNNWRRQIAIYETRLVPAKSSVTERAQKEQNFMLIGVFELIEAKLAEYETYEGYVDAVRNYWLARSELARALGSSLPAEGTGKYLNIESFVAPEVDSMQHHHH